jgi:DNA repair protein NreA
MYCKICQQENCKKHSIFIGKTIKLSQFSGSSPPEIFVGRYNYPNVNIGILSPTEHGNTEILSSHELWHKNHLQIPQVLKFRNQLIYGRTKGNIKSPRLTSSTNSKNSKFLKTMQEISMTDKSISTSFKLKKSISKNLESDSRVPLISNTAPVSEAKLNENPHVKKKVDYLISDNQTKSKTAILELDKSGIQSSSIMKILSAGLLGLKKNRILVPTRWSITAVDSTLSQEKLKQIKLFSQISDFQVFSANYLGNHYHFLLLPSEFQFEVMEISMRNFQLWHDHESFFPRRGYAKSVTGAYYANRLALCEYLQKIKRQASCLVFREIRPEYYAPLGVGILRQTSREAFSSNPARFSSLQEALEHISSLLRIPISHYTNKSIILKNIKQQTRLSEFF